MKIGRMQLTTPRLLAILLAMIVAVVLLTPEESLSGGGRSSLSADAAGTRMAFELAERMGWRATRRTTTLDSTRSTSDVHVVIGAAEALGGTETHRLLEHVRRGGGLVFSMDGGGSEIADSLGMRVGDDTYLLPGSSAAQCDVVERRRQRPVSFLPPHIYAILWRRPPPGAVTMLFASRIDREAAPVAVGFPLRQGRVAAVSSSSLFANDAVRICAWGADVAVARTFEYVRPPSVPKPVMEFDEFHHGLGTHPGSLKAVAMYLSRTSSGHFLAQALIAGLLLLFAAAPRPVVPREPERVVRRSPLDHADALGLAYMDVGATRTATLRLVSGLRRRTARLVVVDARADDGAFLDAVERRTPVLASAVATVRHALHEPRGVRDMTNIGDAVVQIENVLITTPPTSA